MIEIDARGLSCPEPVILAKQEIVKKHPFRILVNGSGQAENIKRVALRAGVSAEITQGSQFDTVEISCSEEASPEKKSKLVNLAISVPGDSFGHGGDSELEDVLCRAYFHTLTELDEMPSTIIFYDRGVLLTIDSSPVLEDLKTLQERGVNLLVCGTCLKHFDVMKRLSAGKISNMFEIATELGRAERHYSI